MFNVIDNIIRSFRYYKTIEELSRLSDRELADIGMYRCEIPFIAFKANLPK
jgi:uncharacterized protein YjiS (DUF1127 family)